MSRVTAMFERVPWWLVVTACLALAAAGCGDGRDRDPERIVERLKTNNDIGVFLDKRFWVDKERTREVSVRQMLAEMGAAVVDGRVLDSSGRELFFFVIHHEYEHPLKGVPPLREREEERIRELEKHYRVVRMYIGRPKH